MARGWESKSIEAQQSEAAEKSTATREKMTPDQAARFREKESLRLARQRILEQIAVSKNPHRREVLELSIAELEERLRKLETGGPPGS